MDTETATKRFFLILFPATFVFVAASVGIAMLDQFAEPSQITLIAISLIPIIAQLLTFWAYWRFVTEIDEFLRAIQIRAVLFGLASILLIATAWGYLEAYAETPRLELLWLNPIYWASYGLGALVFTRRAGSDFW